MSNRLNSGMRRAAYLVPIAALLYAIGEALRFDVLNRAVSVLASAVWGS